MTLAKEHWNKLTKQEEHILLNAGTEYSHTGEYDRHFLSGQYVCKQCEHPLYESSNKFHSGCGWPSFDQEISGHVKRILDPDGRRIEIRCVNCDGHLGHVFEGELITSKNTRHCVNSLSIKFIPSTESDI